MTLWTETDVKSFSDGRGSQSCSGFGATDQALLEQKWSLEFCTAES